MVLQSLSRPELTVKEAGVSKAIEAAGVKLLYLSPLQPGLQSNRKEKAFSKLKALLRKASEPTIDRLWNKIGELLPTFTPRECENFFATAGYEP